MAQREDKDIFAWMDRIHHKELNGVEEIELHEEEEVDEAAWQRIKQRTLDQLDHDEKTAKPLKKAKPRGRTIRRNWLVAASAIVMMITAFISVSPDARAELKKVLQFIPGFGIVQPNEGSEQGTYVLPKPIDSFGDYGKITVTGVLIQSSIAHISLGGDHLSATKVKSLTLETKQGQIEFKRSSASWGGNGPWLADFYYEGSIPYNGLDDGIDVMLKYGRTTIGPLHLTKAETADDIAGFGSSDSKNGIQITGVVTPLDGNTLKVNLLTSLSGDQRVDSFGKKAIAEGLKLQLKDNQGHVISIEEDTGFIKPRELVFDAPAGSDEFQLVIPAIRIIDPGAKRTKVTLPVPEEGSRDINITSEIAGFPVAFTRVEREGDNLLRIEVDTHFDYAQPRTLQSYRTYTKKWGSMPMPDSWKVNERTNAVETVWLRIKPGKKEITFYIGEPQIVVNGPWVLEGLK